ncbi:hypothetical protein V499_08047 [Pseudogymnoascus sp. VKM F-103]|uniref:Major facilitator superfamily (MFS) profile domain-containing protein n=1 Tax=Pseudogymnoascus verrucosus TaxID=342668 RepID=A0A1B8G7U1_9PEZI|nr:uncharacterized protein VE01_10121 [Pseudogymnoascus verrucosus]KFY71779.1 hypothetical protein V499_08047 [Pseudogymnoascus sp. VKM F-103]OBT91900.1 hypothetical protein VE01_10121 [Pseudogymnoascus verrucosus]
MSTTSGDTYVATKDLKGVIPDVHLNVEKPIDQDASKRTSVTDVDIDPVADEKQEAVEAAAPVRDITGWKWGLVVVAILSSIFLFALDNTVVADIQPAIIANFGDIQKLPWLTGAFLIGSASTNLVWGKVYGQMEAKITYLISLVIFEVGSALCGAAPTMNALIIGRVIAGVGGSGMYVGVMTLLSVTTSLQERPMYVGLTGLLWGIGTVLGPIIGGAFTDSSAGWRWAFYINLVIGGAFAPVYLFMLPKSDPRKGVPVLRRFKELDWVGTVILMGAFVSFIMAVSFGGILYAWNSGQIIACFVVAFSLFGIFAVQQELAIFTTVEQRIFPVQFLRSRTMLLLFAETSSAATGIVVPLYMIPLFFQFTQGDTALQAGVRILPYIFLMVFGCIVNGAVLSKYGYYMPWYLGGGILFVIGSALMYTIDSSSTAAQVYGFSVLLGVGVGVFCQASFSVAQGTVKPSEIPSAVGFITCAQITGITISIAIANSVFLNGAEEGIAKLMPDVPRDQIQSAIAGVGSKFVQSLPLEMRQKVLDAIIEAMSKAYVLCITAGALAIVLSLFLKRERLFVAPGLA